VLTPAQPLDLRSTAEAVAARPDAEGALRTLTERFGQFIGARLAVLATFRPDDQGAMIKSVWAQGGSVSLDSEQEVVHELVARAVEMHEPSVVPLPEGDRDRQTATLQEGWLLAVPVPLDRAARGFLAAILPPGSQSLDLALATAQDCAALAAICLRDAEEIAALRELAQRDQLTGCFNRAATRSRLATEILRCERDGGAVSVCLLDLDDFKSVNDRYGHLAGDLVLAEVGLGLRAATRRHEVTGRIGGDEFLVIMSQSRPGAAEAGAQRLCDAVGQLGFDQLDGSLSASFGIAEWAPGKQIDDLLAEADLSLRSIKRDHHRRDHPPGDTLAGRWR
jgi:diguanylate cyclase (GGDEF)-like protein